MHLSCDDTVDICESMGKEPCAKALQQTTEGGSRPEDYHV